MERGTIIDMRLRRSIQAGFSFAELLAVVVIIGVLAAVGVTYFRRHALASKVTEAQAMVQSIRAAEERYRAENRQYLNITSPLPSPSAAGNYPAAPDGSRRSFYRPVTDSDLTNKLWWTLNPVASSPVQFGYAVAAGPSGVNMATPAVAVAPGWATPTDSWYVIQASADNDGNHVYCVVVGTSLNGELYVENEGE